MRRDIHRASEDTALLKMIRVPMKVSGFITSPSGLGVLLKKVITMCLMILLRGTFESYTKLQKLIILFFFRSHSLKFVSHLTS